MDLTKFKINLLTTSEKVLIGILIAIIFIFTCKLIFIDYSHKEVLTVTITDKYVKRNNNNDDVYMVATDTGEAFKIDDLFWIWKFNSTDLYNQLVVGNQYQIEVTRS